MEEEKKENAEVEKDEPVKKDVPEHKPVPQKKNNVTEKIRQNPWILSTVVLGIVTLIFLTGTFSGGMTGNVVSEGEAGDLLIDYLNGVADGEVSLVGVEDQDSFYMVTVGYRGQDVPLYVTKNGAYYTSSLVPLKIDANPSIQTQQPTETLKSDKPEVELFIMTHCPYGTQAEKGFIPMMKALGDSVDAKIRFVHYFMHTNQQEEVETPKQLCIREEQPDKYLDYLECFLSSENQGSVADSEKCLSQVGIDKAKLNSCVSSGKADEYYETDSELSNSYGVRGSPSLVINGVIVNSGRDSNSYLNAVCGAFNTAPDKCSTELSTASPSPGFGYNAGAAAASTAQCG